MALAPRPVLLQVGPIPLTNLLGCQGPSYHPLQHFFTVTYQSGPLTEIRSPTTLQPSHQVLVTRLTRLAFNPLDHRKIYPRHREWGE